MDATKFNVFQSNHLDVLATVLAEQLRLPIDNNPFKEEVILVQSPGMSEWLKINIAQKLGIAANLNFPLPSSFIWNLYKTLIPDVPESSVFNKDRLRWHINRVLVEHVDKPEFASIKEYLNVTDTEKAVGQDFVELKKFKLSEKIADAYDNYLMYRPEWLEHWETGANDLPNNDDIGHQQWQAILWRSLNARINDLGINSHNRHTLHQTLLEKLSQPIPPEFLNAMPSRLFIFGISSIPTHQLDVFEALSRHISVDVLWLNPCQYYWGDILSEKTKARISKQRLELMEQGEASYFVSGNPLLASWGKIGRDYLDALSERDVSFNDLFYPRPEETLLSHVQQDIFDLKYRQSQEPLDIKALNRHTGKRLLKEDGSIKIHNCHSRLRELEVLKDELLNAFEQDPELMPKDVLVMVPDINDYAPFIDSVFGKNLQAAETFMPYAISDRSGLQENPILNTFVSIIGLPIARFKSSDVMDWLTVPVIMRAFDIDMVELEEIKAWVNETHIKWSIDGKQKEKWNLPTDDINTWLFGLKRMMLGVSSGNQSNWQNIPSFDAIEGLKANTLAKLVAYVSYLVNLKTVFEQKATASQWQQRLIQLIEDLFEGHSLTAKRSNGIQNNYQSADQDIQPYVLQQLRDSVKTLNEYQTNKDETNPINAVVVQQVIGQTLNQTGVSQRFLAGRINFCTLMPMRSVPFKVINILGLNDGEFPRHVEPLSFDLVNQNKPRKGDRSRKLDERYLFLEAVCSASDKLHLSYVGQSDKNNQAQAPSLLLAELLDYIGDSFVIDEKWLDDKSEDVIDDEDSLAQSARVKKKLVVKHKLQPFNEVYFAEENPNGINRTFEKQWLEVANRLNYSDANSPTSNAKGTALKVNSNNATTTLEQALESTSVDVQELISFAKNPVKYFYRQLLGINLQLDEQNHDDVEPFEHSGLTKYQFVESLVKTQEETERAAMQWQSLHSGVFPSGRWGSSLFNQYQNQADSLVEKHQLLSEVALSSSDNLSVYQSGEQVFKFSLSVPNKERERHAGHELELSGQYKLHDGVLIINRLHKEIRYEDEVEGWIYHLIRTVNKQPGATVICSLKPNNFVAFEPIEFSDALEQLSLWVGKWYNLTAKQRYFNWSGPLAKQYLKFMDKGADEDASRQQTVLELQKMTQPINGIPVDPYKEKFVTHAFDTEQTSQALPDEFYETSKALVMPLNDSLITLKRKDLASYMDRAVLAAVSLKAKESV